MAKQKLVAQLAGIFPMIEKHDCQYQDIRDGVRALCAKYPDEFRRKTGEEAIEALLNADIAFARVNDMAGLSAHPLPRRITVATPNGDVHYPAPAPRIAGDERHYRPVPGLGEKQGYSLFFTVL